MDRSFHRALVLIEQRRFDLAVPELRKALAADPNDGYLHTLLAECLLERDELREASDEARQAIHLDPESAHAHATLSRALLRRNHYPEAEQLAREALRLDPGNPDYHAQLSAVHLEQRNWTAGLAEAERGLESDPEHIGCNNLRALALVKLGRREEAGVTMASTLARGPEVAFSHANQGWACLHAGDRQQALDHFREALRLDPSLEFARHGIVEAMKASNIIYALFLRYFLWMSRMSRSVQWLIILGGYFGFRLLADFARDNPEFAPWVLPILIAYIAFAVMTWIAAPLFNLLLRMNRYGRYALSRDQVVASNWIGTLILIALTSLIIWLATGFDVALVAALFLGLLLLPVSATFQCQPGWPRKTMAGYAMVLGLLASVIVADIIFAPPWREPVGNAGVLQVFLWGCVLSGFVANFLITQTPRR